jgi:hypothetical protein
MTQLRVVDVDDPDGVLVEPGAVRSVGLGYRANHHGAGVLLVLDRLRETRAELSGELTVTWRTPGGARDQVRGRINLSSFAGRANIARLLALRARGVALDWAHALDQFAVAVLDLERRGEPFELVGRQPVEETVGYRLEPVLTMDDPTILFGAAGSRKTTVANAVGVSVATGKEVIPGWLPTRAPVLVLDWEAKRSTWNDRTARIAAGAALEAPDLHYRRCRRPLPDLVEEVARFVAEHRIGLVIVDSLGMAMPAGRDGADANDGALRLFGALGSLRTTSLLIDHVAGDNLGAERPVAKPYGSVYKQNLARSVFELRSERDAGDSPVQVVIRHTKANDWATLPTQGLTVEYDGPAGPIQFRRSDIDAPDLQSMLSQRDRISRLLRAGPRTPADIARYLNLKGSNVRSVLAKGQERHFTKLPGGLWGVLRDAG